MAKLSQLKNNASSNVVINNNKNNLGAITNTTASVPAKTKRTRRSVPRDSPPQRSSIYRGVTRHRWTGRYEAHLWDKNCWNESQNKKGRQVYLGAYDDEEAAAHTYDLAALKYWGQDTILNFPLATYQNELKEMEGQSREEYIGSLRRKSSGFSRGVSKYRGVARHHHNGRWEARIGRVFGNKYLYLGTYATQEEAATAYDMSAIKYRGLNAVTNFDLSRYIKWLKPNSSNSNINNNTINLTTGQPQSDPNGNNVTTLTTSNPTTQEHRFSFFPNHQSPESFDINGGEEAALTHPGLPVATRTTATSALGLLLQSSKFKEMMEMTSTVDLSMPAPPESEMPPHCRFPDDIQTYFECEDSNSNGEGDDHIMFSELNSFVPPLFNCDDFEAERYSKTTLI